MVTALNCLPICPPRYSAPEAAVHEGGRLCRGRQCSDGGLSDSELCPALEMLLAPQRRALASPCPHLTHGT